MEELLPYAECEAQSQLCNTFEKRVASLSVYFSA